MINRRKPNIVYRLLLLRPGLQCPPRRARKVETLGRQNSAAGGSSVCANGIGKSESRPVSDRLPGLSLPRTAVFIQHEIRDYRCLTIVRLSEAV